MRWTAADVAKVNGKIRRQIAHATDPVLIPGPPKLKYHNHRIVWQGDQFDSKHELEVWQALEAARAIAQYRAVIRQVSLRLPGTKRRIRIDFMIVEHSGQIRWLDAKGYETPEWKLKRDMVRQAYGLTIETC